MTKRRSAITATVTAVLFLYAAVSSADAARWRVFAHGAGSFVIPESINASGVLVGFWTNPANHNPVPFMRLKGGRIKNLHIPNEQGGGTADSINDNGMIAGDYVTAPLVYHGFIRNVDGSYISFDAPGAGQGNNQGTQVSSINSNGAVTGIYFDSQSTWHGYIRAPDANFVSIDPPNGTVGVEARSINDSGTVSGTAWDDNYLSHGLVRMADGTVTLFDAPGAGKGAGQGTTGWDINSAGSITGYFTDIHNRDHGFIRNSDGTFQTFDVAGATETVPMTINTSGEVAGTATIDGYYHGFIRNPDGTIITFEVKNTETQVLGLNSLGKVIGDCAGCRSGSSDVGFVGKP